MSSGINGNTGNCCGDEDYGGKAQNERKSKDDTRSGGKTIIWTVHHHNAPLLLLQLLYSTPHAAATLIYITIKSTTGLLAFLKQSPAAKGL